MSERRGAAVASRDVYDIPTYLRGTGVGWGFGVG